MKRNQKRKVGMKRLLKKHTIYYIDKKENKKVKQKMKTNLDNNNCIEKNVKIKDKGIKLILKSLLKNENPVK